MNRRLFSNWKKRFFSIILSFALTLQTFCLAGAKPVTVTVTDDGSSTNLAPDFLGLSYEMSLLLPKNRHYYFDPNDRVLINLFQTLGIKSLRVGANAVDSEHIPVPQEKDIDVFFDFARAAKVKVIYSFRLKGGDPADSARLASYIMAHDADALDCFAIGNEPDVYLKTYDEFFAQWKPHYDAILKAVPNAMFDGPSGGGKLAYALSLTKALGADGHLKMASDHRYFLGSGRAAEKDSAAARDRFLSNAQHDVYKAQFERIGVPLAAMKMPYRLDEMNSCYNGGAKDSSDSYASALWALDCTHWWAAHHIAGLNYHTGESVGRDGGFAAPNYAAFVHDAAGSGFVVNPEAYAFMAFSQVAHGKPLDVKVDAAPALNFNAYAYRDRDGSLYLTLINKNYGTGAPPAEVTIHAPQVSVLGPPQRMDLTQKDQDAAAKTGVTFGGAAVGAQGTWTGQWIKTAYSRTVDVTIQVPPTSATVVRFPAVK